MQDFEKITKLKKNIFTIIIGCLPILFSVDLLLTRLIDTSILPMLFLMACLICAQNASTTTDKLCLKIIYSLAILVHLYYCHTNTLQSRDLLFFLEGILSVISLQILF